MRLCFFLLLKQIEHVKIIRVALHNVWRKALVCFTPVVRNHGQKLTASTQGTRQGSYSLHR